MVANHEHVPLGSTPRTAEILGLISTESEWALADFTIGRLATSDAERKGITLLRACDRVARVSSTSVGQVGIGADQSLSWWFSQTVGAKRRVVTSGELAAEATPNVTFEYCGTPERTGRSPAAWGHK